MVDIITESARGGRIVFWEEVARDGAQATTLITADVRVRLAREHGRIFGADGSRHLVFAAAFPAWIPGDGGGPGLRRNVSGHDAWPCRARARRGEALLDEARSVDDRVAVDVCLADASRTDTTRP
jgi:hypothetical protein